jgi:hypothetical protein
MFVNPYSTLNYLLEHMAHVDIVKIHLVYHILALRVEEAVIWSRGSLRKDRQSKK